MDEQIDSDKVFAMTTQAVGRLAQDLRQVEPALHPPAPGRGPVIRALGDPVNHQWTTLLVPGLQHRSHPCGAPSSSSTSTNWAATPRSPGLITTNDFGAAYDSGFKASLAQSPRKADIEYVTEKIEPSAATGSRTR